MSSFATMDGTENANVDAPALPAHLQARVDALTAQFTRDVTLEVRREAAAARREAIQKEAADKLKAKEAAADQVRQRKANMPKAAGGASSDAEHVRQFTREAGQAVPSTPQAMNKEEVNFIGKMILDEVMELFQTVYVEKRRDKEREAKRLCVVLCDVVCGVCVCACLCAVCAVRSATS